MTREQVIDVLKQHKSLFAADHGWDSTTIEALILAIDAMEQPEPHWIPVTERLPEDDTEVFVYLFDRQSPYIAWVTDSCWFTEEFQVEKENYPKAWMPLPEPYREKGD